MPRWVVTGAWAAGISVALFYLYESVTLANLQERQLPFGSIIVGFFLYTLPTWLASRRNHEKVFTIATLNVLLGWTILGWIVALKLGLREPDLENPGEFPP
ncbi:MAG: hypothetical protein JWL90_1221 [Chthoniobacteraceae bacterium]|nr:hypothetical protein [Chthoniobacteraceae bacterium]MDB6174170.1 hypothetical protein [Chthoniobacteraceae bacterium]